MDRKVENIDEVLQASGVEDSSTTTTPSPAPAPAPTVVVRRSRLRMVAPANSAAPATSQTHPVAVVRPAAIKVDPNVKIYVNGTPALIWSPPPHSDRSLLQRDTTVGIPQSLNPSSSAGLTEVVMGLDFGTSSTKVVIADRSTKAGYAVPFTDLLGIAAYLLPSQLGELDGQYRLDHKGHCHSDLKLAMLANMDDSAINERVCAFLALVIRSARAWLFTHQRDRYHGKDLVWSLALGQPADQSTSEQSRKHFENLGMAAWALAGGSGDISVASCAEVWARTKAGELQDVDVEVLVMPELAAQIHGFVSSSHFDAHQRHFYLMVDVGAGTVDASLFRVVKRNHGKVDFDFFTSSVETNGAASMHRERVGWWQEKLAPFEQCAELIQKLEEIRLPTELRGAFPNKYSDYVRGPVVHFEGDAKNPDEAFFCRLRQQVVGNVLFGAWKQNYMTQKDLAGVPYFLCGGGARHSLYQRLQPALQRTEGATWLRATPRELMCPTELEANGVLRMDYHRLSVAYGLSKLTLGKVQQVGQLQPIVAIESHVQWDQHYVNKDAC